MAQAAGDREELRRTLAAEFGGAYPDVFRYDHWLDPGKWIAALAMELIAPGSDPGVPEPEPVDSWEGASFTYAGPRPLFHRPDPAAEFRRRNRLPQPEHVAPPHFFLLHRFSPI